MSVYVDLTLLLECGTGFLVIHQKPKKRLDEITNDLCSALTIQQLYRISTMYWDDKYGTETVSPKVLQDMKSQMQTESGLHSSNSFLLDDDTQVGKCNRMKTVAACGPRGHVAVESVAELAEWLLWMWLYRFRSR